MVKHRIAHWARSAGAWLTTNGARVTILVLAAGWIVWLTLALGARDQDAQQATAQANQAEATAEDLAEDVTRVCAEGGRAAVKLGSACSEATRVRIDPEPGPRGKPGEQGEQGPAGRGITGTSITGGQLQVTYTDGTTETIGQVVGPAGPSGPPGEDGRGVTGTSITGGQLQVSYSDGSTETLGTVVGTDGEDGRGVASVARTEDAQLVVTYTDGTTEVVGPLPPGPQGPPGPRGPQGPPGPPGPPGPTCPEGYELREVIYTLAAGGTAEGLGCVRPDSGSEPTSNDEPPIPMPTTTEGP